MPATTDIVVATGNRPASPVNWGAIIAGALVASVATLILMLLGSGLGLSMASPWAGHGAAATTLLASTAIWLVVVQWVSSGLGGYIAGRMRTRWTGVHTDEVFFRDTAHGLLAWALATLLFAGVLGSAIGSAVGTGVQTASNVVSGVAGSAASAAAGNVDGSMMYYVDALLRPAPSSTGTAQQPSEDRTAQEISRILLEGAASGQISADDKTYLSQLIASRAGLSQADAQARVDQVLQRIDQARTQARQAADTARKAGATTAMVGALTLLIGAFIACVSAALGGKLRDEDEDRWALE